MATRMLIGELTIIQHDIEEPLGSRHVVYNAAVAAYLNRPTPSRVQKEGCQLGPCDTCSEAVCIYTILAYLQGRKLYGGRPLNSEHFALVWAMLRRDTPVKAIASELGCSARRVRTYITFIRRAHARAVRGIHAEKMGVPCHT